MERVDESREQALLILVKVFENKSYSNILIKNLKQNFSQLDRAFITELVYGTIKWKKRIDYCIDQFSSIKLNKISTYVLNILRLGIYQIDFLDRVPDSAAVNESVKLAKKYSNIGASKFVNALLRNYIKNKGSIKYPDKSKNLTDYLSVYYSYPEWLVSKLIEEFGKLSAEDFLRSSNEVPYVTIRVNSLKIGKTELKKSLADKGIDVSDGIYAEDALILKNVPGIESLDEYKNGFFTVQDQSSMLAVKALSPKSGELIMDVCSAPGTKSTYIAELMQNKGKVIAGDISKSKLKLVDENAKRLGINIINTVLNDAAKMIDEYINKADRVLIDAPCSGFGIMRKKPEIRWNRKAEDLEALKNMQLSILRASSRYLKPGGILVYSTCTVFKEENLEIVMKFLKENENFKLEDITGYVSDRINKESLKEGYVQLLPNGDGIDGFFISRLKRVK